MNRKLGEVIDNDEMALKIHLKPSDLDNISVESGSGKSEFDEEYYKNRPDVIELRSSRIIEVDNHNISHQILTDNYDLPSIKNKEPKKNSAETPTQKQSESDTYDKKLLMEEEKDCCCWSILNIFCGD